MSYIKSFTISWKIRCSITFEPWMYTNPIFCISLIILARTRIAFCIILNWGILRGLGSKSIFDWVSIYSIVLLVIICPWARNRFINRRILLKIDLVKVFPAHPKAEGFRPWSLWELRLNVISLRRGRRILFLSCYHVLHSLPIADSGWSFGHGII